MRLLLIRFSSQLIYLAKLYRSFDRLTSHFKRSALDRQASVGHITGCRLIVGESWARHHQPTEQSDMNLWQLDYRSSLAQSLSLAYSLLHVTALTYKPSSHRRPLACRYETLAITSRVQPGSAVEGDVISVVRYTQCALRVKRDASV